MILSGGVVGSLLLFIIVFAAWHFRYKRSQPFEVGAFYDTALWISILAILAVGVYGLGSYFDRTYLSLLFGQDTCKLFWKQKFNLINK